MPIDGERLRSALEAYPEHAVFARVEEDRLETLPEAFRDGSYLWKDLEWVVRWYCRRPLAGHDRTAEEAFRENDMETIQAAIEDARSHSGTRDRVEALTTLAGVDVPIASAFLQYIDPESFAAIDERAWRTLREAGAVGSGYPEPVDVDTYETYLRECHGLAATADLRVVDVARALWVLDVEESLTAGRHG